MSAADGPIEFFFSFRSPYARFAALRVLPRVHPEVLVRWRAFFPLPTFPNFGMPVPARTRYIIEDLIRLAKHHGLEVGRPPIAEPDWSVPHAAFVEADRLGRGPELARALFEARWAKGQDVADDEVIRAAARAAELEPEALLAAARDSGNREALTAQVRSDFEERGVFGVPMFVLPDGQRFWGHDRMQWALEHGFVRAA